MSKKHKDRQSKDIVEYLMIVKIILAGSFFSVAVLTFLLSIAQPQWVQTAACSFSSLPQNLQNIKISPL